MAQHAGRITGHKRLRIIFMCFLVSALAGCATQRMASTRPFFFIQMTDTQFGMYTNDVDFSKETIHFEKAIQEANRLHPAFVIVCGDLINQLGNPSQIAEYKRIAAELNPDIPLYNVAGNHDVGSHQPTEKGLATYRRNFGKDYYTFTAHNLFGIVLNSSLFFDPSQVPEEAAKQDAWLRATLKAAKRSHHRSIVVFQHIPWFINQPDEKEGYFNIPLERRKTYLDLFHQYGVHYVFAGHLHKNAEGRDRELDMVTTGAVGKPLGKDSSGFRIVEVNGDTLSHAYYSLEALPDSLTPGP